MPNHHGIKITEISTGARSLGLASTAVIGLVATASDADVAAFPLNTPVLVTDIMAAISKAGVLGTLAKVLDAIADQVNPTLIVVRVAEGANAGETEDNVVGTSANGMLTGLQALLSAEARGMPKPIIIGAPGLDTQEVAAALVTVAQKLNGMAYAKAIGATVADAIDYAGDFSARELMLLWPDFTDFAGSAAARALGLRARIDQETGWHKSLSNVAVQGVTGLNKDVVFDFTGVGGDAKLLNDANVTAVINFSGFRFWGNRTLSDDPLFAFEPAVRTAQVLRTTIGKGLLWAIDKPLTAYLVKDIIDTINNLFRGLKQQGFIIGASAWYTAESNSPADLAAGKLVIDYDFTPCAPAESLTLNQRITDKYYADLASQLS